MSELQLILRQTNTTALTFAGKPSPETIKRLKAAGFKYENGNWFNTASHSQVVSESEVAEHLKP